MSDFHQIFAHDTYGHGSVLIWRRSGTLCTSGFMEDVILAHKPRLLDVAAQLKRSAHAALGLAITVCSSATLSTLPSYFGQLLSLEMELQHLLSGGLIAEWLACWTQAQKDPGSNRSRDAVG